MRHASESTSEIVEKYGDRGAVLARLSWEWTVLHEMAWPGRADATLHHLVIGPSGVFVIVVGDDVTRAAAGADAVAGLLRGLPRDRVHGVLVGPDRPAPWNEIDGVIHCESVDLARMLRSFPPALTREEVAGIVGVVYVGLEQADHVRSAAAEVASADAADAAEAGSAPGGAVAVDGLSQGLIVDVQGVAAVRRRLRLRRGRRSLDSGNAPS